MPQRGFFSKATFYFVLSAYILIWSIVEFERIAWGTGVWLGQFALKMGTCSVPFWIVLHSVPDRHLADPLVSPEAGKNSSVRFVIP